MKKIYYKFLAGLVCFIVFTAFVATGVGAFFLAIFWNAIIVKLWNSISKLGNDIHTNNEVEPVNKDLTKKNDTIENTSVNSAILDTDIVKSNTFSLVDKEEEEEEEEEEKTVLVSNLPNEREKDSNDICKLEIEKKHIYTNDKKKREFIDGEVNIQPKRKKKKLKSLIFVIGGSILIVASVLIYWQISIKEAQKQQVENYLQKANNAYEKELFVLAIGYYKKIIDIDSNNYEAFYKIGLINHIQNNNHEAKSNLEKAILINPKEIEAYLTLGDVYRNLQEYNDAIEYYTKALEINSNNVNAYLSLGLTYTIKGDYQQGLVYIQHALKIKPESSEGYAYLGILYSELEQYNKALEYYQKSLKIKELGWTYRCMSYAYDKMFYHFQDQVDCNIKGALLNDKECQEWCKEHRIEWKK